MDEDEVFGAVAETMLTTTLGAEAINSSVRVAYVAKDNKKCFKNDGYVKVNRLLTLTKILNQSRVGYNTLTMNDLLTLKKT